MRDDEIVMLYRERTAAIERANRLWLLFPRAEEERFSVPMSSIGRGTDWGPDPREFVTSQRERRARRTTCPVLEVGFLEPSRGDNHHTARTLREQPAARLRWRPISMYSSTLARAAPRLPGVVARRAGPRRSAGAPALAVRVTAMGRATTRASAPRGAGTDACPPISTRASPRPRGAQPRLRLPRGVARRQRRRARHAARRRPRAGRRVRARANLEATAEGARRRFLLHARGQGAVHVHAQDAHQLGRAAVVVAAAARVFRVVTQGEGRRRETAAVAPAAARFRSWAASAATALAAVRGQAA